MGDFVSYLPHVNAVLNSSSVLLLFSGYRFIRAGRIGAHRACQIGALVVSGLFLTSYLTYHYYHGTTRFKGEGLVRPIYFTILTSHTILAVVIVPLIAVTFLSCLSTRLRSSSQNSTHYFTALVLRFSYRCNHLRDALPHLSLLMYEKDLQTTVGTRTSEEHKDLQSARRRVRGSGPILILAVLFVAATFLAWYFTWFGRGLSDADISKYLADEKNPRHVQHALVQVQQRLERGDPSVKQWYPQLITLSSSAETEFRLTVAWLMGFDNKSEEFHQALSQLVRDPQPIVRRNAALALIRFNDDSGRQEFLAILKPHAIVSPTSGTIASTLKEGSEVARGSLLARVQHSDGSIVEIRSPLPGRINTIARGNGSSVTTGDEILTLNSDENSVWEALRALSMVGKTEDLEILRSYAGSSSGRIKEQALLTVQSIQNRAK